MIEKMKFTKIIYYSVFTILAIIALLLIVSIFPITGNYNFYVVQSGSMEPAIKTGSVIMVKPMDDYEIGDIISFGEPRPNNPPTTHRIYDMEVIEGKIYYITKGDANNAPDRDRVAKSEVIGKTLISVPYVGYLVSFARKPIGFFLIVIIPALVIIGDEIWKIIKEVKKNNKKE